MPWAQYNLKVHNIAHREYIRGNANTSVETNVPAVTKTNVQIKVEAVVGCLAFCESLYLNWNNILFCLQYFHVIKYKYHTI
jgi:hypothetical protein